MWSTLKPLYAPNRQIPADAYVGGEFNSRRGLWFCATNDYVARTPRVAAEYVEASDFGGRIANRSEIPVVPVYRSTDCITGYG